MPDEKRASAFMNFCKEERSKIDAKNPGMSFHAVTKALGAEWAKLSDAQKAEYK